MISASVALLSPALGDTPSWIVRFTSVMFQVELYVCCGWLASAANGEVHLPPPETPLKPPCPTTPPVFGFHEPVISFVGSLKSTSFTPFGRSRPPGDTLDAPA